MIANWIFDLECMTLDCLPEYTCILGECVCINDADEDGICDEFENETSLEPINKDKKELVKTFDMYGKPSVSNTEQNIIIHIYNDGTVQKEITIKITTS